MTEYINPWKMWVGSFIPNWLMARHELSQGAKLCYARLCQYAGRNAETWPKQETLAEELGCSDREVRRCLDELVVANLIAVERRGLGKPNLYHFLKHAWFAAPDRTGMSSQDRTGMSTPVEENHRREDESSASLDHSENDLTQPPPAVASEVAVFKEAVTGYLAANKGNRVSRFVDIGDSLGYERNGGFAAALVREFEDKLTRAKMVDAMVAGITAKGDPWAYVRRALDGEARRSAGWGKQGGAQPAEGTGGGLVTVSLEEVRAAEAAKADEAARSGAGADAG